MLRRCIWSIVIGGMLASVTQTAIAHSLPESVPTSFVLRLLNPPFRRNPILLRGQLPAQFPANLPLPDRAEIVASVSFEQDQALDVILDVPQSPNKIQQEYSKTLEARGWKREGTSPSVAFTQNQITVQVLVSPRANLSQSRVQLKLQREPKQKTNLDDVLLAQNLIEDLKTVLPQGRKKLVGGGGSNQQTRELLWLETPLNRQAVLEQLEKQASSGKWQRRTAGYQGRLIWSLWKHQDSKGRSWQAKLQIVASDAPQGYFVYLTVAPLDPEFWQFPTIAPADNPKTLPRSFALRLLNLSENSTQQILVGKLPPLPDQTPMPNFPISGSTVSRFAGREHYYLTFDAPPRSRALVKEFEHRLQQAGWKLSDLPLPQEDQGFIDNRGLIPFIKVFCRTQAKVLTLLQFEPARFDVVLSLRNPENNSCRPPNTSTDWKPFESLKLIPVLKLDVPPSAIVVTKGSETSGLDETLESSSKAVIQTTIGVAALAKHYEAQLQQAGWKQIAIAGNSMVQQSVWRVNRNGKTWQALLSFEQRETNPNQYQADLLISSIK